MTVQCSYRTIDCSICRASFFTPVVNGRTVYVDLLGRPACDRCDAPPLIARPAPLDVVFTGAGLGRPARERLLATA